MTFAPPPEDTDVLILAGDIASGINGIKWASDLLKYAKHVICVAGNHEFYGYEYPGLYNDLHSAAEDLGVIFLQDQTTTIDGWNFIGSTLWTDYQFGVESAYEGKRRIQRVLNDFRVIRGGVTPDMFEEANQISKAYIGTQLATFGRDKSIVITHHAPASVSVHPVFEGDDFNAGFINGWDDWIVAEGPHIWFHGHIHAHMDNTLGNTRIIANPRAYGDEHKKYGDPPFTFKSIEV